MRSRRQWCGSHSSCKCEFMRCTIVPPHVLQHVAEEHGDEQVRELVQRTLPLDHEQRLTRDAAQLIAQPPPATTPVAANRTLHDAAHQETLPGKTVRSEGAASWSVRFAATGGVGGGGCAVGCAAARVGGC